MLCVQVSNTGPPLLYFRATSKKHFDLRPVSLIQEGCWGCAGCALYHKGYRQNEHEYGFLISEKHFDTVMPTSLCNIAPCSTIIYSENRSM